MSIAGELVRLRTAPLDELRKRYRELSGADYQGRSRDTLWRRIAWHLQNTGQVDRTAAHPAPDERPAAARAPASSSQTKRPRRPRPGTLAVGTVITRVWHGVEHRITVVEGGYSLDGVTFKTASALARHVTGQHWNGRLWLGLRSRKAKAKR